MKEYHVTIMSIDPDENPEDNHQKYGFNVQAENPEQAKSIAIQRFREEEDSDLPIYWVKAQ